MFSAEIMITRPGQPTGPISAPRGARRARRASVDIAGTIDEAGPRSLCRIIDLSLSGARLMTWQALETHATVMLTLPGQRARMARIVWSDDFEAGCAFDEPLEQAALDQLVARYGFAPALPEVAIFRS
ncbi:PilZ domain-containing protein [Sphingomonas sp. RT2P30]|uniref:PilZ domain-containing protein n=1 Tax=Parasphingomonas halimpatiens TaxID=3096162 RepID=UPI002FC5A116